MYKEQTSVILSELSDLFKSMKNNKFLKIILIAFCAISIASIDILIYKKITHHTDAKNNSNETSISESNTSNKELDTDSSQKTNIKIQANKLAEAVIQGDYAYVASSTPSKVVSMLGGRQKMIDLMKSSTDGAKISAFSMGKPSDILSANGELQATISETLTIEIDGQPGKLISKSTLIAISDDNGSNWKFIDTAGGKTFQQIQAVLPNLSNSLVIPQSQDPEWEL